MAAPPAGSPRHTAIFRIDSTSTKHRASDQRYDNL